MSLEIVPQLVANDGLRALRSAIADPDRYAVEAKVDGVRGLVVFGPDGIETRNRRGERRAWLHGQPLENGLRRLAARLPILDAGTVLDGELVLKDRRAPYRDGSRAGWSKVKDASWYEREAWRFERH